MYYRLSNVADLGELENSFDAKFEHPKIYEPNQLINGLDENLVPIVKQHSDRVIDYAIWGLLPKGFKEEWELFQSQMNTLNIEVDNFEKSNWFNKSLNDNRCIILATGFFTSFLRDGELFPYHVHLPDMQPFAMAGIFSTLDDGFYTTALFTTTYTEELKQIQHLGNQMPFALNTAQQQLWTAADADIADVKEMLYEDPGLSFQANPVSKSFFKNEIRYSEFLERVNYLNLPRLK